MEGWNPFKKEAEKPKVAIDPSTGNVIGSAETPEEIKAKLRQNAEDWKEAA